MHAEGALEEGGRFRLQGTAGKYAAVGEIANGESQTVCWKLDPTFAQWFWPLMTRVVELVLLVPRSMLEPPGPSDALSAPRPPSEKEKRQILKIQELPGDCVQVYTLRIPGKPALVHKAFPTRVANLLILREYRGQRGSAA